jgi:hypothetical protein
MVKCVQMMKRTKEHFHILLPEGYKKVLKIAAARAAISISDLVQLALDNHLTQRSNTDGSKTNDEST